MDLSPVFGRLDPRSVHSSDFIDDPVHMETLLRADPVFSLSDAPEHSEEFELDVQFFEKVRSIRKVTRETRPGDGFDDVEFGGLDALSDGKALVARESGDPTDGPIDQFHAESVDRGAVTFHVQKGRRS